MPEIFEENCELKVIEYGKAESVSDMLKNAKDNIMTMIRF